MPFNTLLLTCLSAGTSFTEAGVQVGIRPEPGETILFFSIDDQSNVTCQFRKNLKIKGPLCDLLILYSRRDKTTLCLVELKGKNLKHAVEQLSNTFHALRSKLRKPLADQIVWKACIRQQGHSPKETKHLRKTLEQTFSAKSNVLITRNRDIGQFLRG